MQTQWYAHLRAQWPKKGDEPCSIGVRHLYPLNQNFGTVSHMVVAAVMGAGAGSMGKTHETFCKFILKSMHFFQQSEC